MKIAIDYDGTITLAPSLWVWFADQARSEGHEVFVVTYRSPTLDRTPTLEAWERHGIPVYYTNGVAKGWWCEHFGPGSVDVWIDDRPKTVYENSSLSPEGLAEWRKEQANPNN